MKLKTHFPTYNQRVRRARYDRNLALLRTFVLLVMLYIPVSFLRFSFVNPELTSMEVIQRWQQALTWN